VEKLVSIKLPRVNSVINEYVVFGNVCHVLLSLCLFVDLVFI